MSRVRLRLSPKLTLLVVLAVVLTAAAASLAAVAVGRAVLRTQALDEADERVEMYARAVEFYLDQARAVLETTARFPPVQRLAIDRELASVVARTANVFEYVMLLRPDGAVLMLEPAPLEQRLSHRNLAFHAWLADVRRLRATVISDLHISPATQHPTVVIATPVVSPGGALAGVWAGALRLDALSRLGRPSEGGGYAYVTDRRGLIIAHQQRASFVENQTDFSVVPAVRRALAGERGRLEFVHPISGTPVLGAYRPLDRNAWAVAYVVPTSVALGAVGPMTRGIVLASAVLALGLGGLGWLLSRRIVEPLRRLTETARSIGAGDFSRRLRVRTGDELEDLAGALDRMAMSLEQVIAAERRARIEVEDQSRRLEEANRLKSEFVANMSHELRTPLNSIIGFAELMYDGKTGPMSDDHREYLGDILTSARHLLRLINDVLDLARVETGAMDFHAEPVDLADLGGEVHDILRGAAGRKGIRLELAVDATLGVAVLDRAKLKQVLDNYVSNAIKFTPDGGRVTIRFAPEGDDAVRLEVEDTGVGIAPEDLGRLFVEFRQLDASAAKREQGTGLGLALTRRIVEAQGGRVGVRSVLGRGSVFFAVLPRASAPATPSPSQPAPARVIDRPAAPILVVDDDPPTLRFAEAALTGRGYRVVGVTSAAGGLRLAAAERPAVVVLDLLMPEMDGFEFLEHYRASDAGRDTQVIVWTAKELTARDNARLGGLATQVVSKHAGGTESLLATVATLLPASGGRG